MTRTKFGELLSATPEPCHLLETVAYLTKILLHPKVRLWLEYLTFTCCRNRVESCAAPGTKACREKMRRDRLNDKYVTLNFVACTFKFLSMNFLIEFVFTTYSCYFILRFTELCSIMEPGKPPKTDKFSILSDATRLLTQLRSEAKKLKESNEALQVSIKNLKVIYYCPSFCFGACNSGSLSLSLDKQILVAFIVQITTIACFLKNTNIF